VELPSTRLRILRKRRFYTLEKRRVFPGEAGEIVAVTGAECEREIHSKLKLIAGALEPAFRQGAAKRAETHLMEPRLRAQRIAMVQQESQLLFPAKVWEFVLQGRHPHGKSLRFERENECCDCQKALLEKVAAHHLMDRSMDQISGGEKQRVTIERGRCTAAAMPASDEPTRLSICATSIFTTGNLVHRTVLK